MATLAGSASPREPDVVMAARRLRAGRLWLPRFEQVFHVVTVDAVRPKRPGFLVANVPDMGRVNVLASPTQAQQRVRR